MWILILTAIVGYFVFDWLRRKFKITNITQKYVFITGCDSGFGHHLAQRLDGMGFHVIAACLTIEGIETLKNKCSSRLKTVQLNVAHEEEIVRVVEHVKSLLSPDAGLWAVVNNAGIGGPVGYSECLSRADYLECLNVNLFGVIDVTKACLPLIRKARGRVVNIASMFGRISSIPAPYCISKYGVEAYSDCLRREVYHQGITVHILEPGFFHTDIINPESLMEKLQRYFSQGSVEFQQFFGPQFLPKSRDLIVEVINKADSDIDKVVDAYVHAVSAKHPKYRYVVGNDAQVLARFLPTLPEWISDYVMCFQNPKPQGAH
ncbi:hypothetical protein LOTGIDRAFT_200713 [Lottia gigantea]|uniref:Uncharacterized protein n=1 Tax=Lottia gigantea TaxID=225164 RepID=V4B2Q3_LOTGI|nr:hypothetical protein LOTGIDRAFT_200713 [Lottia gigantea]ESP00747.1 hypothetical protein LOTGIDRAFT_200713 [Lottia gigantea]